MPFLKRLFDMHNAWKLAVCYAMLITFDNVWIAGCISGLLWALYDEMTEGRS